MIVFQLFNISYSSPNSRGSREESIQVLGVERVCFTMSGRQGNQI